MSPFDGLTLAELDRLACALMEDHHTVTVAADSVASYPAEAHWREQAKISADLYTRVVAARLALK